MSHALKINQRVKNMAPRLSAVKALYPVQPNVYLSNTVIFSARIRRMGEGTVFSLSVHTLTGGYPHLRSGWGVPISQVRIKDTPIPGQDGGRPIPSLDEGVSPSQVKIGGTPMPGQDRGGTPTGIA